MSKGSVKWRKTINEMGGDILVRIFWVAIFRREVFQGEFDFFGWEFFGQEFPWGEFSLNHFFHIMYLFLLFKKLSIDIMSLSTRRYNFKLIKCRAKFLFRNFLLQKARNIFNSKHVKQCKFWVVNKWEVREKCKSLSETCRRL